MGTLKYNLAIEIPHWLCGWSSPVTQICCHPLLWYKKLIAGCSIPAEYNTFCGWTYVKLQPIQWKYHFLSLGSIERRTNMPSKTSQKTRRWTQQTRETLSRLVLLISMAFLRRLTDPDTKDGETVSDHSQPWVLTFFFKPKTCGDYTLKQ